MALFLFCAHCPFFIIGLCGRAQAIGVLMDFIHTRNRDTHLFTTFGVE